MMDSVIEKVFSLLSRACCLALALTMPVHADTLRVGGTGSAGPLIGLLFDEFRKESPAATLELAAPPLGTGGALRALVDGRVDLVFAGRSLKADELARFGRHFELASTPFVFAAADGRRRDGFSLDALASVYAGELMHWDDGAPIRLILRASFESDTLELKAMSPAMARGVDAAARRPGMVMGKDDLDTLALLLQTPGSLGPTTLGLLSSAGKRLTVLPLNGVMPSLATMESGAYPWRKTLTVVLPRTPAPLAARFADFLRGEKARAVMSRYDYLAPLP